jgi:hypothetical protein
MLSACAEEERVNARARLAADHLPAFENHEEYAEAQIETTMEAHRNEKL